MNLLTNLKFYLFTAAASAVMTYSAHHSGIIPHDLAVWLLGVFGHAIGVEHQTQMGNNGSSGP